VIYTGDWSTSNKPSIMTKDIVKLANILPKQTVIDLLNSEKFHYTKYFGK